jgi:hypothetical protein
VQQCARRKWQASRQVRTSRLIQNAVTPGALVMVAGWNIA